MEPKKDYSIIGQVIYNDDDLNPFWNNGFNRAYMSEFQYREVPFKCFDFDEKCANQ
jgi:hypothetical protein